MEPMHIRTSVQAHDSEPIPAKYFQTIGVAANTVDRWVGIAQEECFNPGLSDIEVEKICKIVAFRWDFNKFKGKFTQTNYMKTVQEELLKAFSKIETEKIKRETTGRSHKIISMTECEPAEPQDYHPRANVN